jgi:hypothetical protein
MGGFYIKSRHGVKVLFKTSLILAIDDSKETDSMLWVNSPMLVMARGKSA